MIDETTALKHLHETYVILTGLNVSFDFRRMEAWRLWLAKGWGPKELFGVIRLIKGKWRNPLPALSFSRLIENTSSFEELVADWKVRGRIPKIDAGKAEVLRATGREVERKPMARSAEQVLRDAKAFDDFKQFCRTL